MNTYIYDIEVFQDDWIVVASRPEKDAAPIVIHNDNDRLRAFINQPDIILGGFNNKHYDDYIIMVMLNGGSNIEVKRANDFIINGGKGWEIPFIQYQKKPFKSFDLRDDIADKGLSLKAIEGNLKLPIVESSIPFTLPRKLKPDELEEVIKYCINDVESTKALYWARKENYIDAKIMAGGMYDIPPAVAVGCTNAKLAATALEAQYTERDDERDYVIPENIDVSKIPEVVLNFFLQIRDKSIPPAKLFGAGKGSKGMTLDIMLRTSAGCCPVTYAWGGVHGAKPCITVKETADRVIINWDVSSLYPNSMINFGYTSRSMKDPKAYEKLVKKRLGYKHAGDKMKANALKLIVNTVYGAMLATGNGLNDRLCGRSVCITNQLAMTMLIVELSEQCASIDFININTDGIMFSIDRCEVDRSTDIVMSWCDITGFEMERDDFKTVIQKDVNNYIGIKIDGKMKTKGSYVSLFNGGNFKTNSLSIIHKAIVNYLVDGIAPEKTIEECTDIFEFQNIVKTGSTYDQTLHIVNGCKVPVQRVNRVYAVKNPAYGQIYKSKLITEKRKKNAVTGCMDVIPVNPPERREEIISECPQHAYIDNENKLTVNDLDLSYYIDMAKKRIDKYLNIDTKTKNKIAKIKEEVAIMATEKTPLNIYQKLGLARKTWLDAGVKPSGKNTYAEYKYFTLEDIEPVKIKIFNDIGLLDVFTMDKEMAYLNIMNADEPAEVIGFYIPVVNDESLIKNPIQSLGATRTYLLRYLYLTMLDIQEVDLVELEANKGATQEAKPAKPAKKTAAKKAAKPVTAEERKEIKKELINEDGAAAATTIKAIKAGLKKLRDDPDNRYQAYVLKQAKYLKSNPDITKKDAENLLKEIGDKVIEAEIQF